MMTGENRPTLKIRGKIMREIRREMVGETMVDSKFTMRITN
jgi:hypothetical protein